MRTLWAALLSAAALAALLGGWAVTGWRSVSAEAAALEAAPRDRAARQAAVLAAELGARLEELVAAEDQRPYYEYQNLYHDPRGASEGKAVAPSPLARGPADALVEAHFQIAADGRVSLPTINDEVPELSAPGRQADRRLLAELRAGAGKLRPPPAPLQAAADPPPQQAQVQAFDPDAYAQNVSPNQVYREVQAKRGGARAVPAPPERDPIAIRVEPFGWRTAELAGQPRLVALRSIDTPDGILTQGFALAPAAVTAWLAERAGGLPAALIAGSPDDSRASAPLPVAGSTWQVAVDPGAALATASAAAREVRSDFLWRLVPAGLLALLCGALVVTLVARADRLARERSEFAAAAAHELRTPLAGLALYGDMLADGLGDPGRRTDYAQRVADEAGRLGRVVTNVLGFTQLERRGLSMSPRPGDAAATARDAVDRIRPSLQHAGVTLEVDIPESAPARFDEDAVTRIVQNLLDNAEKYSRGAAERTIELAVRAEADAVIIEVADRGPGVARQLRGRLFRPFARGSGDGGPAGLGLGLALARTQARAMGGDLAHRDRDGGGAIFSLRFPAA